MRLNEVKKKYEALLFQSLKTSKKVDFKCYAKKCLNKLFCNDKMEIIVNKVEQYFHHYGIEQQWNWIYGLVWETK